MLKIVDVLLSEKMESAFGVYCTVRSEASSPVITALCQAAFQRSS